jgi:hypothetical protein
MVGFRPLVLGACSGGCIASHGSAFSAHVGGTNRVLDGLRSDWDGSTFATTYVVDEGGRALVDTEVATATDVAGIWIYYSVGPAESSTGRPLVVDIDCEGMSDIDVALTVQSAGALAVSGYVEDSFGRRTWSVINRLTGQASIGEGGTELLLPWEALTERGQCVEPRGWIRINLRHSILNRHVLSVASLDSRSPLIPTNCGGQGARVIMMPLEGRWYVSGGHHRSAYSHPGWAWDLTVIDLASRQFQGDDQLDSHYAFAAPVVAALSGEVKASIGSAPDSETGIPSLSRASNRIEIASGRYRLLYGHLRQSSVEFKRGDVVTEGQYIAAVGNSGADRPHLHLEMSKDGETVPLAFRDVTVSLNLPESSPLRWQLGCWVPEEGFFVERTHGAGSP